MFKHPYCNDRIKFSIERTEATPGVQVTTISKCVNSPKIRNHVIYGMQLCEIL